MTDSYIPNGLCGISLNLITLQKFLTRTAELKYIIVTPFQKTL